MCSALGKTCLGLVTVTEYIYAFRWLFGFCTWILQCRTDCSEWSCKTRLYWLNNSVAVQRVTIIHAITIAILYLTYKEHICLVFCNVLIVSWLSCFISVPKYIKYAMGLHTGSFKIQQFLCSSYTLFQSKSKIHIRLIICSAEKTVSSQTLWPWKSKPI